MARITPEERQQNLNKFLSISKVRNGAGDPVVLYHVTPKDFSTFKAGGHDPEISGPATWLTPHKGHYPAWHNVGGDNGDFKPGTNVMPVHANITSPLVLDTPEMLDWARHVYANKSIDFPHYIHPETKAQLVEDGYDGIFFAGFHGKRHSTVPYDNIGIGEQPHKDEEIIALHPETQLKSAIGNNGDFDPSIPDVTKAEGGEVDEPGITAYHGSPHDFPRFDMSKIGTGEGNQTFGHGLYFAEHEPVATGYRDKLSEGTYKTDSGEIFDPYKNLEHMNVRVAAYKGIDPAIERATGLLQDNPNDDRIHRDLEKLHAMKAQNAAPHKGHMYEVHINAHPDHFLDWDKPFHEQSDHVQKALMSVPNFEDMGHYKSGMNMGVLINKGLIPHTYDRASPEFSKAYHAAGVKGVKYLDAGSRGTSEAPTRNYVVFDDKLVNVERKYAEGGSVAE
jgi:hypothetical protein